MAVPVVVYSTTIWPYCVRAKQLLKQKGVDYEDINLDKRPELRNDVMKRSGRRTVPQIWVGETHVGGFDELWALDRAGKLDPLLQGA